MNEREAERQMHEAEKMFDRYVNWNKDIYLCPFDKETAPWSHAHWWQRVSQHSKTELSKEVVAS